jgi:hypothetical protein
MKTKTLLLITLLIGSLSFPLLVQAKTEMARPVKQTIKKYHVNKERITVPIDSIGKIFWNQNDKVVAEEKEFPVVHDLEHLQDDGNGIVAPKQAPKVLKAKSVSEEFDGELKTQKYGDSDTAELDTTEPDTLEADVDLDETISPTTTPATNTETEEDSTVAIDYKTTFNLVVKADITLQDDTTMHVSGNPNVTVYGQDGAEIISGTCSKTMSTYSFTGLDGVNERREMSAIQDDDYIECKFIDVGTNGYSLKDISNVAISTTGALSMAVDNVEISMVFETSKILPSACITSISNSHDGCDDYQSEVSIDF